MNFQLLHPAWGVTVVRLMTGLILVVAGYNKLTTGIGGFQGFLGNIGVPAPELFAPLVVMLELVGGAAILVGLLTRWIAMLFVIEFIVTTFVVKLPRQPPAGGWDAARIDLMILAAAIAFVLVGPGKLAVDELLLRRRAAASPAPL